MSHRLALSFLILLMTVVAGCSPQQNAWKKARQADTAEAYEQFLKRYPSGDFTAQAQARLKDLYTERDWQTARDADTADAYQTFLKEHPEGKDADEARRRIEDFTLGQTPGTASAGTAGGETPTANVTGAPPTTAGAPAAGGMAAAGGAAAPGAMAGPAAHGQTSSSTGPSSAGGSASTSPSASTSASAAKSAHQGAASAQDAAGRYRVQLGAFRSGGAAAAHRHWASLKKHYPTLLKGLTPKVIATRTSSGLVYRLQVVGVSEHHARHLCASLKAHSQSCVVVRPAHT